MKNVIKHLRNVQQTYKMDAFHYYFVHHINIRNNAGLVLMEKLLNKTLISSILLKQEFVHGIQIKMSV